MYLKIKLFVLWIIFRVQHCVECSWVAPFNSLLLYLGTIFIKKVKTTPFLSFMFLFTLQILPHCLRTFFISFWLSKYHYIHLITNFLGLVDTYQVLVHIQVLFQTFILVI